MFGVCTKKKLKLSIIDEKPSEIIIVKDVDDANETYPNSLLNDALKLKDKEWLSDDHIFAFFQILQRQFQDINGLFPPVTKAILQYSKKGIKSSTVFINNVDNHWITYTNLNSNNENDSNFSQWTVYDSLHYSKNKHIPTFKALLPSYEYAIINRAKVQKQEGFDDCGLFALAFATTLCFNLNPINLIFDQIKMRDHYKNCIQSNTVTMFPHTEKKLTNRIPKIIFDHIKLK